MKDKIKNKKFLIVLGIVIVVCILIGVVVGVSLFGKSSSEIKLKDGKKVSIK